MGPALAVGVRPLPPRRSPPTLVLILLVGQKPHLLLDLLERVDLLHELDLILVNYKPVVLIPAEIATCAAATAAAATLDAVHAVPVALGHLVDACAPQVDLRIASVAEQHLVGRVRNGGGQAYCARTRAATVAALQLTCECLVVRLALSTLLSVGDLMGALHTTRRANWQGGRWQR